MELSKIVSQILELYFSIFFIYFKIRIPPMFLCSILHRSIIFFHSFSFFSKLRFPHVPRFDITQVIYSVPVSFSYSFSSFLFPLDFPPFLSSLLSLSFFSSMFVSLCAFFAWSAALSLSTSSSLSDAVSASGSCYTNITSDKHCIYIRRFCCCVVSHVSIWNNGSIRNPTPCPILARKRLGFGLVLTQSDQ